jgi:ubiquinone/menaquinone biosynthesis C-methylase UbiE
MVDWDAGRYERTAAELEPVAKAVVDAAQPRANERVLDLACGTGNAALLVAARGARVIGVDTAPRLLEVARERARSLDVEAEFRQGDLLELPVTDGSADVVLSVFGLIFAPDPARALAEVARVAAAGARVLLSAWIPAGPINDMLAAMARVGAEVRGVMIDVLREANEDPGGFLVHSPYVVHEFARGR